VHGDALWPALPERVPMHFDLTGRADRWVERSWLAWFVLPGLGTAMTLGFALALPRWIRRLAAENSSYLNVPRKRDFARLAPDARLRAIAPMLVLMRLIGAEVSLLFAAILFGSARVASGEWERLPPALAFGSIALVALTAFGSIPFGAASVRRELELAGASKMRHSPSA